ncbi:phage/plasmid primase, P4 family [Roseomonas sp. CECT 9278]|uniref:phage/plasmid primase, P4 family n=1 Tax=Roseomonas sp. CECT 9278 TaxID=2845823 RepID=UPI001E5E9B81
MTDDIETVRVLRANLWRQGFRPVAVCNPDDPGNSPGKRPVGRAWQERARQVPPEAAVVPPAPDALNTGILCDGLRAIDIDCDDAAIAAAIRAEAERRFGGTLTRTRSSSPRVLLLYRADEGEPSKRILDGVRGKVEVLGHGNQFVTFGRHATGAVLEWEPLGPDLLPTTALPSVSEEALTGFLAAVASLIGADPAMAAPRAQRERAENAREMLVEPDTPGAIEAARERITRTPGAVQGTQSDAAYKLACAVRELGVSLHTTWQLMVEGWADRCSPPIMPDDLLQRVENAFAHAQNPGGSKHPTVMYAGVHVDPPPPPPAVPPAPEMHNPATTEEALARRFTEQEGERLRYVAAWNRWMVWDGTCWRREDTKLAFDIARRICRTEAEHCRDSGQAAALLKSSTVAAVERFAQADRQHAATVDQWDADPWLLNTPAGIVDLRTGDVGPHDPAACMTKITAAAPAGECPTWLRFLDRITGGDAELQGFLARMAGYALTGSTREHALFFLYGTGGNGKGVFLNTLSNLFGAYAKTAPIETFTASATDRHPTDMAMLQGARLVAAQETEVDRRWAESRIKALTGGDPISARFMRQDFFEFTPQFKLVIAGNHKPGLRAVDEAMRRRLHMIPFAVTIPAGERDQGLSDRLRAEWGGILAWAIAGCMEWQRIGLAPPAIVREATDAYLAAEDTLGLWLAECCAVAPDRYALTSTLFGSWSEWAKRAGVAPGTTMAFSQALDGRGFTWKRQGGTGKYGYQGLEIRLHGMAVETPPIPASFQSKA